MKVEIFYDAKCKHCKWFDYHYKGKRKVHKCNLTEEQLPKHDGTVLVWINDTENPQWSGYKLGSYLNEKWYCNGGRKSHEIVTDWCNIPAKKK